ncbi:hypothetical protein P0Y35_18250 [Kiritimatiellaeota bacterium B1221]|nr:hypothetical protein [Kiritimatiellaeota bacterium B1221]
MSDPRFCPQSQKALAQLVQHLSPGILPEGRPWLVGIGGPGGGGKSMLSDWLKRSVPNCAVLSLDDFRLPRNSRPRHAPFGSHPDAVDVSRLQQVLQSARKGGPVHQPVFDSKAGHAQHHELLPAADIWLLDGEITAYEMLDAYLDIRILVQSSLWTQFMTRLNRDRGDRGCSLSKTLKIYIQSNLKDHPRFAKGAEDKAQLIFYRHPRKGLHLRKDFLNF